MKFFLPVLIFFLYSFHAYSQEFELVGTEESYFIQAGKLHKSDIAIKNNSQQSLRLAIRILDTDFDENTLNPTICAGDQCLQENGILEINTLAPGEVLADLSFSFQAGGQEAKGEVRYLIFDTDNPTNAIENSVLIHVQGDFPTGIMYQRPDMTVSNAYPNPIVSHATMDYSLDSFHEARVLVMNLLGNKVMEFELLRGQNSLDIPADGLPNGIYFYTLQVDGKNVATKKIVVRK